MELRNQERCSAGTKRPGWQSCSVVEMEAECADAVFGWKDQREPSVEEEQRVQRRLQGGTAMRRGLQPEQRVVLELSLAALW